MKAFLGFCLAVSMALASSPAYGVDAIAIGGSASDTGSVPGTMPFAGLSVLEIAPATITLDPSDGEAVIPLTIQTFNSTGVDWDGLLFELTGGSFASAPFPVFGGPAATLGSGGFAATLNTPLNPGGTYLLSAQISVDTEPVVLSLTPIAPIPSPGSLVVCVVGLILLPGRRLGRG
ncbi:MAG: hypothetical protein AAF593_01300 [Planctomycetota bacterium]